MKRTVIIKKLLPHELSTLYPSIVTVFVVMWILFPLSKSFGQTGQVNYSFEEVCPLPSEVFGMALDKNQVLYFSDTYSRLDNNSRVYTLSPPYDGSLMQTEIEGRSLAGLLWHNDLLYVAFLNKDEVVVYDEFLEFYESRPVSSPYHFATDGDNIFLLTYFGKLGVISGNRIRFFVEDLIRPFDILYSGEESLWITQKNMKLTELAYNGEVNRVVDQELVDPRGLAMDSKGNVFLADAGANAIYKLSPLGEISIICDKYESPNCLVVLPNDDLLVATNHQGGMLIKISASR